MAGDAWALSRRAMLAWFAPATSSDDPQPGGKGFVRPQLDMDEVIFGSSG